MYNFIIFVISSCISQAVLASVIMPGIDFTMRQFDQYTTLYILQVDSAKYRVTAHRAKDLGSSVAFAGQFAQHLSAVAVINGGFFRVNSEELRSIVPAGALKIDDRWYGVAYKQRGAIGWDPSDGAIVFDRIQTKTKLMINNINLPVNVVNKLPGNGKSALLNDSYIDQIEVIDAHVYTIENGQVTATYNNGKLYVPSRGYVYYARHSVDLHRNVSVGDKVTLTINATPQLTQNESNLSKWLKIPNIVAAGPLLIKNNKILDDYASEGMGGEFIQGKHARTAIGVNAKGNWIMVAVSKNYLVGKGGMTIVELANTMLGLGCVDALNLDGGGSTAMYVQNQIDLNIANPVADVIAVSPKY